MLEGPATEAEIDHIVANMKRASMYTRYMRIVEDMIPAAMLRPSRPMFTRQVTTSSMNVAAMAAAKQGYDAGRWAPGPGACIYLGQDGRSVFLRRAWLVGYRAGLEVSPHMSPQPLGHHPVIIT